MNSVGPDTLHANWLASQAGQEGKDRKQKSQPGADHALSYIGTNLD